MTIHGTFYLSFYTSHIKRFFPEKLCTETVCADVDAKLFLDFFNISKICLFKIINIYPKAKTPLPMEVILGAD
jgi:hypothetical protein